MRPFALEFSLVQFMCCEQALTIAPSSEADGVVGIVDCTVVVAGVVVAVVAVVVVVVVVVVGDAVEVERTGVVDSDAVEVITVDDNACAVTLVVVGVRAVVAAVELAATVGPAIVPGSVTTK